MISDVLQCPKGSSTYSHNKSQWGYGPLFLQCIWAANTMLKYNMMTSSNGNIFRVTGPLCGEFTGPSEFPAQRPVTRSFDVFFSLRLVIWDARWSLWRHRNESKGYPIKLSVKIQTVRNLIHWPLRCESIFTIVFLKLILRIDILNTPCAIQPHWW